MKRRSVCFPEELDALLVAHANNHNENISDTMRQAVEKYVLAGGIEPPSEDAAQQLLILQVGFIIKAFADTVDASLVSDALKRARRSAAAFGLSTLPETFDILERVQ